MNESITVTIPTQIVFELVEAYVRKTHGSIDATFARGKVHIKSKRETSVTFEKAEAANGTNGTSDGGSGGTAPATTAAAAPAVPV